MCWCGAGFWSWCCQAVYLSGAGAGAWGAVTPGGWRRVPAPLCQAAAYLPVYAVTAGSYFARQLRFLLRARTPRSVSALQEATERPRSGGVRREQTRVGRTELPSGRRSHFRNLVCVSFTCPHDARRRSVKLAWRDHPGESGRALSEHGAQAGHACSIASPLALPRGSHPTQNPSAS
jgi:hypothetical protein